MCGFFSTFKRWSFISACSHPYGNEAWCRLQFIVSTYLQNKWLFHTDLPAINWALEVHRLVIARSLELCTVGHNDSYCVQNFGIIFIVFIGTDFFCTETWSGALMFRSKCNLPKNAYAFFMGTRQAKVQNRQQHVANSAMLDERHSQIVTA